MRHQKLYLKETLPLLARFVTPVAVGLLVSGCVSTETSFLPSNSELQLAQPSGLDPLLDETETAAAAEITDNALPVPQNRDGSLVAAYSAPAAGSASTSPEALAAQTSATPTPEQILAAGIVGNSRTANTALVQPASLNVAETSTANLNKQTSLVAASQAKQQEKSFFSRLFAKQQPKAAVPIENAQIRPGEGQDVAASPQEVAALPSVTAERKKQISQANEVTQAAAVPLAPSSTAKKRTNVFSSLFGRKTVIEEKKPKSKPIEVASASIGGLARLSPLALKRQTERVDVACFKPELVRLLKKIENYYRRPVVVTSGYRSPKANRRIGGASGSKHTTCEAADIQIEGISKWDIAKYARSLPDRGGVGTYCHTQSVHIDIGSPRDWNWRCRKRRK